jgi:(1->4)-alpha-D-glucan 1-alpha-D-glucosylmutase
MLADIRAREEADLPGLLRDLLADPGDGRCKLFLTHRALRARAAQPSVFQYGEYLPLSVEGPRRESVLAFARSFGRNWCIAVAPRFLASFVPEGRSPLGRSLWGDTRIKIPGEAPAVWVDSVSGEELLAEGGFLAVGEALGRFPAALLSGA